MQPIPSTDQGKTVHQFQFDKSVQNTFHNLSFGGFDVTNPTSGIPIVDNMRGYWWIGTTPATPNTDFAIQHNLGEIIVCGWLVTWKNVACDVYHGAGTDDKNNIYLRCTVASANLKIFVLG